MSSTTMDPPLNLVMDGSLKQKLKDYLKAELELLARQVAEEISPPKHKPMGEDEQLPLLPSNSEKVLKDDSVLFQEKETRVLEEIKRENQKRYASELLIQIQQQKQKRIEAKLEQERWLMRYDPEQQMLAQNNDSVNNKRGGAPVIDGELGTKLNLQLLLPSPPQKEEGDLLLTERALKDLGKQQSEKKNTTKHSLLEQIEQRRQRREIEKKRLVLENRKEEQRIERESIELRNQFLIQTGRANEVVPLPPLPRKKNDNDVDEILLVGKSKNDKVLPLKEALSSLQRPELASDALAEHPTPVRPSAEDMVISASSVKGYSMKELFDSLTKSQDEIALLKIDMEKIAIAMKRVSFQTRLIERELRSRGHIAATADTRAEFYDDSNDASTRKQRRITMPPQQLSAQSSLDSDGFIYYPPQQQQIMRGEEEEEEEFPILGGRGNEDDEDDEGLDEEVTRNKPSQLHRESSADTRSLPIALSPDLPHQVSSFSNSQLQQQQQQNRMVNQQQLRYPSHRQIGFQRQRQQQVVTDDPTMFENEDYQFKHQASLSRDSGFSAGIINPRRFRINLPPTNSNNNLRKSPLQQQQQPHRMQPIQAQTSSSIDGETDEGVVQDINRVGGGGGGDPNGGRFVRFGSEEEEEEEEEMDEDRGDLRMMRGDQQIDDDASTSQNSRDVHSGEDEQEEDHNGDDLIVDEDDVEPLVVEGQYFIYVAEKDPNDPTTGSTMSSKRGASGDKNSSAPSQNTNNNTNNAASSGEQQHYVTTNKPLDEGPGHAALIALQRAAVASDDDEDDDDDDDNFGKDERKVKKTHNHATNEEEKDKSAILEEQESLWRRHKKNSRESLGTKKSDEESTLSTGTPHLDPADHPLSPREVLSSALIGAKLKTVEDLALQATSSTSSTSSSASSLIATGNLKTSTVHQESSSAATASNVVPAASSIHPEMHRNPSLISSGSFLILDTNTTDIGDRFLREALNKEVTLSSTSENDEEEIRDGSF